MQKTPMLRKFKLGNFARQGLQFGLGAYYFDYHSISQ